MLQPPIKNNTTSSEVTSVIDLTYDDLFESSDLSVLALESSSSVTPFVEEVVSRPEVIRTADDTRGELSLRFDLTKISNSWRGLRQSLDTASTRRGQADAASKVLQDAGITDAASDDVATEALARTISKEDFGSMDILGQFNLGFIITRRRKEDDEGAAMDDLFIVDQHAADEKYKFETLQQTTHIKSQKLFRSQPLELTAGDELLALENIDMLRQNGFEVETEAEGAAGQGPRLSLTAQPVSKDTVFDMKDLEELIHRMRDQPAGQMVRCSKARAMFAMRACRKSVMIGMPLTKGQMATVVRHMGTMDQPWNCPHGRPTMRHLADILGEQNRRGVDWAGFS
ncbi:MutL C terminal dimerization domain-containing protein [Mycena capillaripes]|nr:MutL C terminal dimerization domain-containing protein [Mycena capillaripes]